MMPHHPRRRRRVHCSVARTGAAVKLCGVECSGGNLGSCGEMCVLLTPCRDSRARTFLECMEDLSTKETCPPHIRGKELRCGSGKWHTLFGTADQIDGTE